MKETVEYCVAKERSTYRKSIEKLLRAWKQIFLYISLLSWIVSFYHLNTNRIRNVKVNLLNNFIRPLSYSLCTACTLPYLEILCYMVAYLSGREYCETFSQISRIVIVTLDIISIKISTQLLWYPWEIYDLKMDNEIEIQQIVGGVDLEKLENPATRRRPLFMWVSQTIHNRYLL